MRDFIILLVFVIVAFVVATIFGLKIKQNEIEKRAYKMKKECYTNQDIEVIIFGEI